jgi:hypothetical protein
MTPTATVPAATAMPMASATAMPVAATTMSAAAMSTARGCFGCHTGHADDECRSGNQSEAEFA